MLDLAARALELAFLGRDFVGARAAVVEEFGEPGGGTPIRAAGLNDGKKRLRDGIEPGFGDLLGELFVALHGVEDRSMMHAELSGSLAERKPVGHQAEDATFEQIVEQE